MLSNVLISIGTAVLGAIVGWWLTVLYTRRRDRQKLLKERNDKALKACSQIIELVQNWKVAIHQAIDPALNPGQNITKLRDLNLNGDYQRRISEQLDELAGDPAYHLLRTTSSSLRKERSKVNVMLPQ